MRLKRNRIRTLYPYKRTTMKDSEGTTYQEYSPAGSFSGISWPTSADLQQKLYGAVLNEAYSIKVDGHYERTREGEKVIYILENGVRLSALDGICLEDGSDVPEYEIRVIHPYEHLQLEVVRLDRRT